MGHDWRHSPKPEPLVPCWAKAWTAAYACTSPRRQALEEPGRETLVTSVSSVSELALSAPGRARSLCSTSHLGRLVSAVRRYQDSKSTQICKPKCTLSTMPISGTLPLLHDIPAAKAVHMIGDLRLVYCTVDTGYKLHETFTDPPLDAPEIRNQSPGDVERGCKESSDRTTTKQHHTTPQSDED